MRRAIFLFQITFVLVSCNSKDNSKNESSIDTISAIQFGIQHLFDTVSFAPSFHSEPIKVVAGTYISMNDSIVVNGEKCEIVASTQSREEMMKFLYMPKPYIEVKRFHKNKRGQIQMELVTRSTGGYFFFLLESKNNSWIIRNFQIANI